MGSNEFLPVYPYSFSEAKRLGEVDRWKESHEENVACRKAIEAAILLSYNGTRLCTDCAEDVIDTFGFHRAGVVLANSLRKKADEEQISRGNLDWANSFQIPNDGGYNAAYAAANGASVLEAFVNQYRRAYQALGMFDHTHCLPETTKQDFEGRVVVLSADVLNERSLAPENQLWLCTGGFGSHAGASGRGVFATCLSDGEKTRWNREDFAGVLADANLPDWAREKLEQLRGQTQSEAPAMGGMEMQ